MTDDKNWGGASPTSKFLGQRSWVRWVVVGSLAINLFFIGAAASHFIFNERSGGRGPVAEADPLKHAFRGYVRDLPKGERMTIHMTMRKSFRKIRPEFKKYRALTLEVASLIEAETVEKQALKETLEELSQVKGNLELRGRNAVFDQILTFPLEARRKIAENMRREPRRRHRRDHSDQKHHEDSIPDVDAEAKAPTP